MNDKNAQFGVFDTDGEGKKFLRTVTDKNGRPLMTYHDAVLRMQELPDNYKMHVNTYKWTPTNIALHN